MKKFRIEYIISIVIIIAMVLVVVLGMQKKDITKKEFHSKNLTTPIAQTESPEPSEAPSSDGAKATAAPKTSAKPSNGAVSKKAPDNKTDSKSAATDDYLTCTLSVRCDTILNNTDKLSAEKINIIPDDGIVLPETEVKFSDGESAFDVLQRELKKDNIHMEFQKTAAYNTVYVEGIANIYQFDCGELSGWTYSVNDKFPNYGCSDYKLQDGDDLKFLYTCDMGADVGADYAAQ